MDEIQLEPYDARWPQRYVTERDFILTCFAPPPLAIEHIGSTAVPDLAAKPVIDIIVLVRDLAEGRAAIPALEAAGYSYWRDNPDRTRLFLVKGLPPAPHRTHHLHIYANPKELDRHTAFRDYLRGDPIARHGYETLKRRLATEYRQDREAYTEGKSHFIDAAVSRGPGDGT